MDKLQGLSARFEQYIGQVFPEFSKMTPKALPELAQLRSMIEKRRPLVTIQQVEHSVDECIQQVEQLQASSSSLSDVGLVLSNAKSVAAFKQKVLESNSRAFTKMVEIYKTTLEQLGEFNAKAERILKTENSGSLDPKSILPNMYSVIREFAKNIGNITSGIKLLLHKNRYYTPGEFDPADIETLPNLCGMLAESLKLEAGRIETLQTELSSANTSSTEVLKLKAINQLKMLVRRLQRGEDTEAESSLFSTVCAMSNQLMSRVEDSARIYNMMHKLAETCYTSKFVRIEVVEQHKRIYEGIRAATESTVISSYFEYFQLVKSARDESAEECIFLKKLLAITLDSGHVQEKLFLNHYKNDISLAVEQINILIGAFTKLKCYLGDCEELLKIEAERVSLFRELEEGSAQIETRAAVLSPRSKKNEMGKLVSVLTKAVLDHAGLKETAKRKLHFLESAPFSLQQVQQYGPYLDNCHLVLMKSLKQMHSRMTSGEFDFQPTRKQPTAVMPQVSMVQTRQVSDEDFIRTWYFDERNFDPDEAYRIDTTYRLHEAAKARSTENLPSKMRYDISSLLVYTSSGKDLNWRLMADLVTLFSGWFNRQTNSQTNRSGQEFKEASSKLRKQIDVHLENCSRYDNSQVDQVIGKFYIQRTDAEKKLRLLIENGMGMYGACDRLEAEVFKVERVFEYSNQPLFYALNNTAVALIEINNLTSEWISAAKSEAQSEFCFKSKNHAESLTQSVIQFVGSSDLRAYLQFVQLCRNMQDINEMHQGILYQLEECLVLTGVDATKKITQQCKLYMSLREDKLMPQFQTLLDVKVPSIFSSMSKEDLLGIKRTIDENAELLVLVHDFLQENYGNGTKGLAEVNENKRQLRKQLADSLRESNPVIRKWTEQYVRTFLAEY